MRATFNLVDQKWVPCITSGGQEVELGLCDVLVQAHELREIGGESPLVTAALHRLFLAVLHRVFGPPGIKEWAVLWQAGRWDSRAVELYLEAWRHHFDLFDAERPFFQARDSRVKPKPVSSLIHDVASGNNPVLFDHHTDQEGITLTAGEAARMLVAAQSFGLAGLSGLSQKFTDGPCARGVVFLVQGRNLFETLMLNLLPYPTDESTLPHSADDRPAWEMADPLVPDRSRPLGYLDYLTWQNRRVLFFPEIDRENVVVRQMTMAPALRLDADILDPLTHYRRDELLGPRPLAFREDRGLWRDSTALFQLQDPGYRPPAVFAWLAELTYGGCVNRSQTLRYLALGMSKKQAKVNFYRSERMPLPMAYLTDPSLVEGLRDAITMAEDVGRRLWGAARTLATFLLSPEADDESGRQPAREDLDALMGQWAVERRFWARLEISFRQTVERLPGDREGQLERWRRVLERAAWQAFDAVAENVGQDPASLKATVRSRGQLAVGLARALPSERQTL